VLVIEDDESYSQLLYQVLTRRGYTTVVKNDPHQALNWLRVPGNLPDLVITDLMMPGMTGHEVLRQLRADPLTAKLPVIMLTAKGEITDKVAGYEAGADDYLVKPVHPVDLDLRIKALLARVQGAPRVTATSTATVIVVFSLRGGVGVTSLAVNLAVALTFLWRSRMAVLDLALTNAHCGLLLNLKPRHSIADLVDWKGTAVEPEVLERLLLDHDVGVRLLAAPPDPVIAEKITPAVIDRAWPFLRANHRFLVVDAGSQLSEVAVTALERAHSIVLPVTPELGSLKAFTEVMRVFDQLGYALERVKPVLNLALGQEGLPQKTIESVLGRPLAAVVPYERGFVRAINAGRPLLLNDPKSPASLVIASLAYRLSPAELRAETVSKPSDWLRKVRQVVERK